MKILMQIVTVLWVFSMPITYLMQQAAFENRNADLIKAGIHRLGDVGDGGHVVLPSGIPMRGVVFDRLMRDEYSKIGYNSITYPTGCYAVIMLVLVVFHLTGEKQPEQQPTTTRPASLVVAVEPEPPPIVIPPMSPIKLFDHLEEHL